MGSSFPIHCPLEGGLSSLKSERHSFVLEVTLMDEEIEFFWESLCQDGHSSRQDGSSGLTFVHLYRLIHMLSHGHRNWAYAHVCKYTCASACLHTLVTDDGHQICYLNWASAGSVLLFSAFCVSWESFILYPDISCWLCFSWLLLQLCLYWS